MPEALQPVTVKEVPNTKQELNIRKIRSTDAPAIQRLVSGAALLDDNSFYCYFLLATKFTDTCAVADDNGKLAGFITGFMPPETPETLFVWQLFVQPEYRGRGVAKNLIMSVLETQQILPSFIEATLTPTNVASRRTFDSVARTFQCEVQQTSYLTADDFTSDGGEHEAEDLLRVGPLQGKQSFLA